VVHSLEHFFYHVTSNCTKKCSFVYLFIVCSMNSFSPYLKCLESMILLIFSLSLIHKCSQHLIDWIPPLCNATMFYSYIKKTVFFPSIIMLHTQQNYKVKYTQ
jgi:hypothetical protein